MEEYTSLAVTQREARLLARGGAQAGVVSIVAIHGMFPLHSIANSCSEGIERPYRVL